MLCCYILSIPSLKVKSHIVVVPMGIMVARQTPEDGGLGTQRIFMYPMLMSNAIKEKEKGSSSQNSATSSE